MKKIITLLYVLVSLAVLLYVALPNFDFPLPPPDSVRSNEPADMETPLRRAYFTNLTRSEVLDWYDMGFNKTAFANIRYPTYLMNYPPEESGSIIRDQTRSTFLQEYVHPFRETLFINGYEPKPDDDENRIVIDGVHWRQKIIVKFVPTNTWLRFIVTLLALVAIPVLAIGYGRDLKFFKNAGIMVLKKAVKSRRINS
jgi:hypothetical protein